MAEEVEGLVDWIAYGGRSGSVDDSAADGRAERGAPRATSLAAWSNPRGSVPFKRSQSAALNMRIVLP